MRLPMALRIRGWRSVGRQYYERKRREGKTPKEALRCLKRRLSDLACYQLLAGQHGTIKACGSPATPPPTRPASTSPAARSHRAAPLSKRPHRRVRRARLERRPPCRHRDPRRQHAPPPRPPRPSRNQRLKRRPLDREEPFGAQRMTGPGAGAQHWYRRPAWGRMLEGAPARQGTATRLRLGGGLSI